MSDDCGNSGMSMDEFVELYQEASLSLFYKKTHSVVNPGSQEPSDSWCRKKARKTIENNKALYAYIKKYNDSRSLRTPSSLVKALAAFRRTADYGTQREAADLLED